MENTSGNARNEMGMRLREINIKMWGIWVEMQKNWGTRVVMQGIMVET